MLVSLYNLWSIRPVNILYIYSDFGGQIFIVVDHLPWTDKDKIAWYLTQQKQLKSKYPLLEGEEHTYFIIEAGKDFIRYKDYHDGPYEDLYCFQR